MTTPKIAVIVGSTRPGRKAHHVAAWVCERAKTRDTASYEVVDIADFDLPLLDEPVPPMAGQYSRPHSTKWARVIDSMDGFVFVTPEYNHSTSAALKNAIDYLFAEWNDKAGAFVSYGVNGGVRAVEQLRAVLGELKVADVRASLALSVFHDFDDDSRVVPDDRHDSTLDAVFTDLERWTSALMPLRAAP